MHFFDIHTHFLFTLKVESSVSPYTQLDIFGWAKIRRKNAENSNCYTLFSSQFDTFDVGMFRCYIRMSFAVFYDLWPMWIAFYSIVIQIIDTLNMINHFFWCVNKILIVSVDWPRFICIKETINNIYVQFMSNTPQLRWMFSFCCLLHTNKKIRKIVWERWTFTKLMQSE